MGKGEIEGYKVLEVKGNTGYSRKFLEKKSGFTPSSKLGLFCITLAVLEIVEEPVLLCVFLSVPGRFLPSGLRTKVSLVVQ